MTRQEIIDLINANVTTNANRENTGARVNTTLQSIIDYTDNFSGATVTGTSYVYIEDTYADFPATGDADSLYVTKDFNIIYRYDDALNTYVILNDPNIVNPDAPEEGGTFFARLATNAALNTCTYNNGVSGSGATLTATANGVLSQNNQTGRIDNVVPALGDVILIKNQASTIQNGLYEVTQLGDVSNPFILTRIDGYSETSQVFPSVVFINAGTTNANKFFNQSTVNPVIGTNGLVYTVSTVSQPAQPVLLMDTATSSSLPACTYTTGTAYPSTLPGFGATLRANANGALGTINGVTLTSGMRIIVNNQADQTQNGSYTVTNAGSATQRWTLTRYSTDTAARYQIREYLINNPNSTLFGSRFTLSTPLNILNTQWGSTNIEFTKNNKLQDILTSNGQVMLDSQNIISQDFLGELKMGFDYNGGFESYLYRQQDINGESRVGLYTEGKGLVLWDTNGSNPSSATLYSDNIIVIKNGSSFNIPNDGDLIIENAIGKVKLDSTGTAINNKCNFILGENDDANLYVTTSGDTLLGALTIDSVGRASIGGTNAVVMTQLESTGFTEVAKVEITTDSTININSSLNAVNAIGTTVYISDLNDNNYLDVDGVNNRVNLFSTTGQIKVGNNDYNRILFDGSGNTYVYAIGTLTLASDNPIVMSNFPTYANDAAADADTNLQSGSLYKITGSRVVSQKP